MTIVEDIEVKPLRDFTEKAYLDYSMYVILDRALPNIGDGLKPVQRRIIYAMSELGLSALAKYKKSARTVGDVLGKFHPHGEAACYEAMVLMAQQFSTRYPLIDGQGNWGAPDDPKSFAAMRYTEARLTPYAQILLSELEQGTVDWVANFDGTLSEPSLLPARLPNVLLNGATGIAVGMATDIPPHNLTEVAQACVYLLDNPKASLEEICQIIQGPDFPTQAEIITPKHDILAIYRQGQGSLRMRATYIQEQGDIIITALPHQVSGAKVLEQIAAQMQAKKLPMIEDLRDESDHENPTRLVIVPRSNRIDVDAVMAHLFATTELERTYRINLNMVGIDGKPQVKRLDDLLREWLDFRTQTVKRRLQFRLEKVLARLHVLEGLLIAFLNIDEVIKIIRQEDEPKPVLMDRFGLTDLQTEAILELKLRHLARLEEVKIRGEQADLAKERAQLEKLLASAKHLKALIRRELEEDIARYGDARLSPIVTRPEAQAMREMDLVPSEPVTVILSQMGWVRMAKGHEVDGASLNYKAGDHYRMAATGRSNQLVVFLDSTGRSYSFPAHSLPSARGQGEPLTGRISPIAGASFIAALLGEETLHYVIASNAGYAFITPLKELYCKNRSGKTVLNLTLGAKPLIPRAIQEADMAYLAVVTNTGRLLIFPAKDLPILARGKGNKLINLPRAKLAKGEEHVIDIAVLNPQNSLLLAVGKRTLTLKPTDWIHYKGQRGQRGQPLPKGYQRVEHLQVI